MAILHVEGFDHILATEFSLYGYTGLGSALTIETGRFSGSSSVGFGSSGASRRFIKTLSSSFTTLVVGFGFKKLSGSTFEDGHIGRFEEAGTPSSRIWLRSDGKLVLRSGSSSTDLAASNLVISDDTWYYIEIKVIYGASAANTQTIVRVNNKIEIDFTGDVGADLQAGTWRFGGTGTTSTTRSLNDMRIDDWYIAEDFLGDCRVETFEPQSTSAGTNYTATGAATVHEALDEATQDGDTTYAEGTGTVGDKAMCKFDGQFAVSPTTIKAATLVDVSKKTDTGTRNNRARCESDTATATSADRALSATSYEGRYHIFETDPNTSAAWTQANLEAAFFGVESR